MLHISHMIKKFETDNTYFFELSKKTYLTRQISWYEAKF